MSAPAIRRWSLASLRVRLLLAILAWVALGIGGIWFSATQVFSRHVAEQYHEELEVHLQELAGLVHILPGDRIELTRPLSDPRYQVPLAGFYWQVSIGVGQVLRSPSLTGHLLDEEIAHGTAIIHRIESGPTGPAIVYGFTRLTPAGRNVHFVIATDARLLEEDIAGFSRELTGWLVALAAALLATGIALVTLGFRPLDRLAVAIARLRAGQSTRLEGDYPPEIAPVVADLNAYIAHTGALVDKARIEAGNLAHALRTPLAVITDEAERLATRAATHASGQVLLDQARAMVQQIEYRLARARSAADARRPGAATDVATVLPAIVSAMRRLHPDKTFTLPPPGGEAALLAIDPVDLSELLSILLDNAGKWARTAVTVSVLPGGTVRIADDGPGLAAEQRARAFDIGVRFDPAMPGSGLGLAIARDLAQAWNLRLELKDNGTGLVAEVGPTA